jgi:rare lipoprotein A
MMRNYKTFIYPLLCFAFILLNGCSSTTVQQDGPPSYSVDSSKVPDAIPKKEPLSKYGNQPVYRVYGKAYHTLKTSANYHERGVASWYGTKFHKQRTSSGERYDMLGMTAAHKTLPLPTYVQVTNLANGKKIIVKVNDRGPFESHRIIDLSYVAAQKLGMLGHGTALVDVKAIDVNNPENEPRNIFSLFANNKKSTPVETNSNNVSIPQTTAAKSSSSQIFIQVGAFRNKTYAENLKNRLAAVISTPIQITQLARSSRLLYHVEIGPINDYATVDLITKRLKLIGINTKRTVV